MTWLARGLCALVAWSLSSSAVLAHDPVPNPAVEAPCILQVWVQPGEILARLEIEAGSVHVLGNLLPSKSHGDDSNSKGFEKRIQPERQRRFFDEDLVLRIDDKRLQGEILDLRWARKTLRDPKSTTPLPPDQQTGPRCLHVTVRYRIEGRPRNLSIAVPADEPGGTAPGIGLRVYHRDVPVADFAILAGEETLHLDWEDPWFSCFENPLFFRFNRDLLQIFLYVDAMELRAQVLCRPRDLEEALGLGLVEGDEISVPAQEKLLGRLRRVLPAHLGLRVDGQPADVRLASLDLLRLGIGSTERLAPDRPVRTADTFVGAVFTLPASAWPKTVELTWNLYPKRAPFAIGTPVDVKEGRSVEMSRESPTLTWENELEVAPLPVFRALPSPPSPRRIPLPLPSVFLGVGGLTLLTMILLGRRPRITLGSLGLLCIAMSLLASDVGVIRVQDPREHPVEIDAQEAQLILHAALTNIYGACQLSDEGRIYDGLARSVDGPLLPKLFLQVRNSLEVSQEEGVMTKVDTVDLQHPTVGAPREPQAFEAQCTWQVAGSVGHWGHWHRRFQEYAARLRMEVRDGTWKLTDLDLQSERRL